MEEKREENTRGYVDSFTCSIRGILTQIAPCFVSGKDCSKNFAVGMGKNGPIAGEETVSRESFKKKGKVIACL